MEAKLSFLKTLCPSQDDDEIIPVSRMYIVFSFFFFTFKPFWCRRQLEYVPKCNVISFFFSNNEVQANPLKTYNVT